MSADICMYIYICTYIGMPSCTYTPIYVNKEKTYAHTLSSVPED